MMAIQRTPHNNAHDILRYWALAIPVWIMTLVWFIFISFMSINLMNTAPFDSFTCITGNVFSWCDMHFAACARLNQLIELHDK